jgi:hypothetical protein
VFTVVVVMPLVEVVVSELTGDEFVFHVAVVKEVHKLFKPKK